jgi:hypothetical protein
MEVPRNPFVVHDHPLVGAAVLAAALGVALVSAHDYAGSMNDGSRLAAVESLVDHHTLAIDDSIFVRVSPPVDGVPGPYKKGEAVFKDGTFDKVFIDGHFYSHTGPVQCVLMAGLYRAWQWGTGLTARQAPDRFCYAMTVGSSGLAYVVSVYCVYLIGGVVGLPVERRLALTAAFALATLALPYVRNVNSHVVLLAVASALTLGLARLAQAPAGRRGPRRALGLGALAGLGYTIDLGAGPPLLLAAAALVAYRCRRLGPLAAFALGALPWLALHHALNYAIGGTFGPYAAVPAYFRWPGSPFNEQNLTGVWSNHGPLDLAAYAAGLLVSRRGFLVHNLPLWLALPGVVMLWRRRPAEWPEVVFAAGWGVTTWLVYALGSTGYGGGACSIRWFVPLLGPGFFVLAVCLREAPRLTGDFLLLSGWGAAAGALMWYQSAWMEHSVPLLRLLPALALLHWGAYRLRLLRRRRPPAAGVEESPPMRHAA